MLLGAFMNYNEYFNAAKIIAEEIIEKAKLVKGNVLVVGCSTSEIIGSKIGSNSVPEVADAVFDGLYSVLSERGVYIAAQCCEHLNRAIVVSKTALPYAECVNVVPQPKAGGSFATAAYKKLPDAVVVEEIKADAGIDIGFTLIGMHLKKVAVPVRLVNNKIGEATVLAARVRAKFIGGSRAVYDENLI